jgi:hypothetical protein
MFRAKRNYQPVRSPLRSTSRISRVVKYSRGIALIQVVTEYAA